MTLSSNSVAIADFRTAIGMAGRIETKFESLFAKQPVENFQPDEAVFFEGDPARHVFEIVVGVVRLCKIVLDGRRVITGFLFAGDIVGVSQKERFNCCAEAVTPAKIRRINRRSLDEAVAFSPSLRPQVFSRMCDEMAAAQEQMVVLACKTAEERISTFLATLLKRQRIAGESPAPIELPMARQDIADYLGLTVETVSRNFTKLARKGILADVERFSVRVIKPDLLNRLAGMWEEGGDGDFAVSGASRH